MASALFLYICYVNVKGKWPQFDAQSSQTIPLLEKETRMHKAIHKTICTPETSSKGVIGRFRASGSLGNATNIAYVNVLSLQ